LGTQETIANPRPAAETNIIGGLNILQAAAQYNVPGVNIAVGNYWMDNTYSITKTTVERFCNMFRVELGLPVTVVRAMNAFGPGQIPAAPYGPSKVRKIIPAFVCRALNGDPVEVYGDGSQIMDMVYVTDVAETLVAALKYTEENGPIATPIQCGTGRPTTVKEIAQAVIDAVGEGELKYLPMRPGEPEHSIVLADPETMLPVGINVDNFISLEDGVKSAVEYFRDIL
jgi:UDP-glucose 4-epimerase